MILSTLPTSINQARELAASIRYQPGWLTDVLAAVEWVDAPESQRKQAARLFRAVARELREQAK